MAFRSYVTCEFPLYRTFPPSLGLTNTVCTTSCLLRSILPSCFTSREHNGSPHSNQSSIVSHCFPVITWTKKNPFIVWILLLKYSERNGGDMRFTCLEIRMKPSCSLISFSIQSKYLRKLRNFAFWLLL